MAWSDLEIFDEEGILEPRELVSEYVFGLSGFSQEVRVRVYRYLAPPQPNEPFFFTTSHAIKTPLQADFYHPGARWSDDPKYALRRGVDSIASYYREAVSKGYVPDQDWLNDNVDF